MMGKLVHAALGCACASLAISIIAIALPYWVYSETSFSWGSSVIYYGLWTTCNQSETRGQQEPAVCASIVTGPHFIALTRAFELTGLLFLAIAVILGFLMFSATLRNPAFLCVAGGLAAAAGPFMILGAIIFGARTVGLEEKGATLHVGFAFAVLSGVLAVAAGVMFLGS